MAPSRETVSTVRVLTNRNVLVMKNAIKVCLVRRRERLVHVAVV